MSFNRLFTNGMCGRYQLINDFINLPDLLKKDMPRGLSQKYEPQVLIKPGAPILVLKNEGKTQTSIMFWGFISEWSKDPFDNTRPKPFNARSESVEEKKLFRASWRHKRCLIPASGFLEKGHLISRKDSQTFWLAGLWNRWMSQEGSELESCWSAMARVILIVLKVLPTPLLVSLDGSTISGMACTYFFYL